MQDGRWIARLVRHRVFFLQHVLVKSRASESQDFGKASCRMLRCGNRSSLNLHIKFSALQTFRFLQLYLCQLGFSWGNSCLNTNVCLLKGRTYSARFLRYQIVVSLRGYCFLISATSEMHRQFVLQEVYPCGERYTFRRNSCNFVHSRKLRLADSSHRSQAYLLSQAAIS